MRSLGESSGLVDMPISIHSNRTTAASPWARRLHTWSYFAREVEHDVRLETGASSMDQQQRTEPAAQTHGDDRADALVLGPEMLRSSRQSPSQDQPGAPPRGQEPPVRTPREQDLRPGRVCENECILFDETHQTSWIIYPPRSAYDFVRRPTPETTVVEYHPWSPMSIVAHHPLRPDAGCTIHGVTCAANVAIRAAIGLGWDPFR
jgi:hypothetical protein